MREALIRSIVFMALFQISFGFQTPLTVARSSSLQYRTHCNFQRCKAHQWEQKHYAGYASDGPTPLSMSLASRALFKLAKNTKNLLASDATLPSGVISDPEMQKQLYEAGAKGQNFLGRGRSGVTRSGNAMGGIQFLILTAVGVFGFIVANQKWTEYYTKRNALAAGYGPSMIEHYEEGGDLVDMHKTIAKKIGPGWREDMFKTFVVEFAKLGSVSEANTEAFKKVVKAFGFNEMKVVELVIHQCKRAPLTSYVERRANLCFMLNRICTSEEALERLKSLELILMRAFGNGEEEDGQEIFNGYIKQLRNGLYRAEVELEREAIENKTLKTMPEGWMALGLTKEDAEGVFKITRARILEEAEQAYEATRFDGVVISANDPSLRVTLDMFNENMRTSEEDEGGDRKPEPKNEFTDLIAREIRESIAIKKAETLAGQDSANLKTTLLEDDDEDEISDLRLQYMDEEDVLTKVIENQVRKADAPDVDPGLKGLENLKAAKNNKQETYSHTCGSCGYTMFVAAGREHVIMGENFQCPSCNAGKDQFTMKPVDTSGALFQ